MNLSENFLFLVFGCLGEFIKQPSYSLCIVGKYVRCERYRKYKSRVKQKRKPTTINPIREKQNNIHIKRCHGKTEMPIHIRKNLNQQPEKKKWITPLKRGTYLIAPLRSSTTLKMVNSKQH